MGYSTDVAEYTPGGISSQLVEGHAMPVMTIALAAVVGVALGMLGGGGSILMVPLLTYVGGLDARQAITTSLLVVGVTSAIGAIGHARAGHVRWGIGLLFGMAGMAGAYGGGLMARFVPPSALLVGFAVLMCVAAMAMLRDRANLSNGRRA